MRRDQLNPHKTATYVMPRWKAVYVSVNKAACTSLKWLVAELQGEDPERFRRSLSREVGRAMTIHRRTMFQHTPMLHRLSDEQLAEIGPENGWFIFAVVRHPAARVWSAWQSKFLLREPRFFMDHGTEPWVPRVPERTADVVEDFERFIVAMAADPGQPVMRDRHFTAQKQLLVPDTLPYSRIYDTPEIPELLADFERHLRAQGWEGDHLRLQRNNETPLLPIAEVFTPAVREGLWALYREDYEQFGYADVVPPKLAPGPGYTDGELAEVARLVDRHERIGDLAMRAQELARERDALRELHGGPLRRRLAAALAGRRPQGSKS